MEVQTSVETDSLQNDSEKKKEENVLSDVFTDYCSSTSLHGVGYLGAKDKAMPEKIWWITVFILSMSMCSYMITKTWIKWKNNPVILSFEQEQTPVWAIPFPAVTICPVNKIRQTQYNYTEMYRKRDNLTEEEMKPFWDISLMCDLEQYAEVFNCPFNTTDEDAIQNILNVVPTISMSIGEVNWQGELNTELLYEQLTSDGVCFTFNSFSQNDMYTDKINHNITYINHNLLNMGWDLESGYNTESSMEGHPRRTAKDGFGSGLNIQLYELDTDNDYVCGQPITGYKVILHNPAELPRPDQQYFLIPSNRQANLIVTPELTTTSENLLYMSPDSRKCYLSHEKSLNFFKVYTQNNCKIECAVNVTKSFCDCVPFYMPHEKGTAICAYGKIKCVLNSQKKILQFAMMKKGINATNIKKDAEQYKIFEKCDCLPSCSDLQFTAETSNTEIFIMKKVLAAGLFDDMDENFLKSLAEDIIKLTEIDIFFKESQFLALHRSELYGQTDFLANCGGLLGLFMGFSILSIVEIIYYLTIRLWFKFKYNKKKSF